MKSCFSQTQLAVRADRRVGVDPTPCPGLYEREIERRGEGRTRKHEG